MFVKLLTMTNDRKKRKRQGVSDICIYNNLRNFALQSILHSLSITSSNITACQQESWRKKNSVSLRQNKTRCLCNLLSCGSFVSCTISYYTPRSTCTPIPITLIPYFLLLSRVKPLVNCLCLWQWLCCCCASLLCLPLGRIAWHSRFAEQFSR